MWAPDEVALPTNPCRGGTPACAAGVHKGASTHHLRPRSLGGSNHPRNLVTLCVDAHRWVHRNPAAALQRGLLVLPPHFDHADRPLPDCDCVTCGPLDTRPGTWWP